LYATHEIATQIVVSDADQLAYGRFEFLCITSTAASPVSSDAIK
jgi:hypothetical protein